MIYEAPEYVEKSQQQLFAAKSGRRSLSGSLLPKAKFAWLRHPDRNFGYNSYSKAR
jgi:hypothetical protein